MRTTFDIQKRALAVGSRVFIRKPEVSDEKEFMENIVHSRKFHYPWIVNKATSSFYTAYLLRFERGSEGHLVCSNETKAIVGVININDITRGALQSGYLGFYSFIPYARKGYLSEGLQLIINRAFNALSLHRLEANIQPQNSASKSFVIRHGFKREGYSRRYLKVNGRWKDHERWALLKNEWQPAN
jgi:ribosomal-protein-alanine N-acetyltransferase